MLSKAYERFCSNLSRLLRKTITDRQLARALMILLPFMLLPLMAVALYNYPADDDFGYVLPAATAWVQTGSLWQALKAAFQKIYETYVNWQGAFTSTAHMALSPLIFNQHLYFLSNWATLLSLCLVTGYLVRGIMCRMLHASRSAFWIIYTAIMVLILQFMPSFSDAMMWHTGGVYTITVIQLLLILGILVHCSNGNSGAFAVLRTVLLFLLGLLVGGGSYSAMLGAFTLLLVLTIHCFLTHSHRRFFCLTAFLGCAVGMIISVTAPGNLVRIERTQETLSPLYTVITAVLDSFDVFGSMLSPQLLAMLMLILPAAWIPLRESPYRFRHPVWVFVMLYGLFSASIAPAIYTQTDYMMDRYSNVVYLYFLICSIGSALYAEGWLIRRLQNSGTRKSALVLDACSDLGKRFSAVFLALVIALTAFGGFEFTIMNTSSVSAIKSLVTGEAARFHEEMMERQEYIRVTDSDVVAVTPLKNQPYIFKQDRLPFQGIYGRVRYMKWYFELFHNANQ